MVVDTFGDLPHTRELRANYARVWKQPAKRVVNTHHNGDHCWSNQLFPAAEIIEPTPPTTLIEDWLELELEDIRVHLLYVDPAHTAGDVIVHLPDHRVVFSGDILFRLCTPIGWEGTFDGWLNTRK